MPQMIFLIERGSDMKLGEKIRVSLENNEWTQKHFSELMNVAPTTVQKWVVGKNTPSVETAMEISRILEIPIQDLLNDKVEIQSYFIYDANFYSDHYKDSVHTIIDANLKGNAVLHRFNNNVGCAYSAIYCGKDEVWSQIRERERTMVRAWNEWGYKIYDRRID